MAAADANLYTSRDISLWQAALLCYEDVVILKAAGKSKKTSKAATKEDTLVELDAWYN